MRTAIVAVVLALPIAGCGGDDVDETVPSDDRFEISVDLFTDLGVDVERAAAQELAALLIPRPP